MVDYRDDGIGADSERVKFGSGMAVINSWISVLGAKNKISTKPGSGYRFSCQIPF
jgi:signal transduction histidine kinase